MMAMEELRTVNSTYGGTILPGNFKGNDGDIVDAFESYGKLINNNITQSERKFIKSMLS